MRGVLITFEGVEGSGKTTQAQLLVEYLRGKGVEAIFTREPGGTEIGERVREIVLDPKIERMDALAELFLYLASRTQLVREKLMPALAAGKVVVSDRFTDSSVAYQGYGRGLGERLVSRLNKIATRGLKPDLTVFIDVPVGVGSKRKQGKPDRLEKEREEFHRLVRAGYLKIAQRAKGRIKIVNGERTKEEIQSEIGSLVEGFLERKGVLRK
ncbi:MAG: dTMP kinase [candidate division WOR-3 bacterium]